MDNNQSLNEQNNSQEPSDSGREKSDGKEKIKSGTKSRLAIYLGLIIIVLSFIIIKQTVFKGKTTEEQKSSEKMTKGEPAGGESEDTTFMATDLSESGAENSKPSKGKSGARERADEAAGGDKKISDKESQEQDSIANASASTSEGKYLQDYKKVLKGSKNPDDLHYNLGRLYLEKNSLDDALQEFFKILEKFPDSKPAQEGIAKAYSRYPNKDVAFREMKNLSTKYPNSAVFTFELGRLHKSKGEWAVAVQLLNKAMKMDPNSDKIKAEYHRTMAQVLINQQKIPDALNELDQALSANPRSKSIQKDYHLLKSKLLRQEGKYLLASEEAQKAMELDPHSPAVLFNYSIAMGYWHKSQKELGKAIEEFKKASEIFPKTLGLQIMLGQLFYESGEYEESVFHFKAVLEKTPENFKAHYYLAKVYENKEWIDLAQEQWSWVLLKSTKAKITEEARAHLYLIDKIRKEKSS